MIKIKHKLFLFVTILQTLYFAGCYSNSQTFVTQTTMPTKSLPIKNPTFTSIPPTKTLNPPVVSTFDLKREIIYISSGEVKTIGFLDINSGRNLLIKECIFCYSISWSSNENLLAFDASFALGNSGQIYVYDMKNAELNKITSDTHGKYDVSWSPDGKHLVYVEQNSQTAETDLVVISSDGNDLRKITYTNGYKISPIWSPDGNKVAYLYRKNVYGKVNELWLTDKNGQNPYNIPDIPVKSTKISWSPDGEKIVFVSGNDCGELNYISLSDSSIQKITNIAGCIENPSWSPDGDFIMFIASESKSDRLDSNKWQIYIIRPDGSELYKITSFSDWRPFLAIWGTAQR